MRDAYHEQLAALRGELARMGARCGEAVSLAVRAAAKGDRAAAEKTREAEAEIDRMERNVEARCLRLLLKQQPVAGELREISAALKVITDLERIGDQASDIADLSRFAPTAGPAAETLARMACEAASMVDGSVEAFTQRNAALARQVIAGDDALDALFSQARRELIGAIAEDPPDGEKWLDALMIAKYLERIGDHAVNVCEWAAFAAEGERGRREE